MVEGAASLLLSRLDRHTMNSPVWVHAQQLRALTVKGLELQGLVQSSTRSLPRPWLRVKERAKAKSLAPKLTKRLGRATIQTGHTGVLPHTAQQCARTTLVPTFNVPVVHQEETRGQAAVCFVAQMDIPQLLARVGHSLQAVAMLSVQAVHELHMSGYRSSLVLAGKSPPWCFSSHIAIGLSTPVVELHELIRIGSAYKRQAATLVSPPTAKAVPST
eukprot:731510-Amphidinium_carterae.1